MFPIVPMPYLTLQSMFDAALPPGTRTYLKANNIDELSDEVIRTIHGETSRMPPGRSMLFVVQMGGAVARVAEDAAAFGGRSAPFQTQSLGIWDEPEQKASTVKWVRGLSSALEPHGRGAYVNLTDHQDESALRATYGTEKYGRLQRIKAKYDPENVFRLNQNITPGHRP